MPDTLGGRIRDARLRYGMSQAELARRIGISSTALNQIESGKTPDPGVSRIIGVARVLGVSTDWLLLGKDGDIALPVPSAPTKRQRTRQTAPVG